MFIRKIPWTTRPTSSVSINNSNPLGSTLYCGIFTGVDGVTIDAVSGRVHDGLNIYSDLKHDGLEFTVDGTDKVDVPVNFTTLQRGAITWYYRNTDTLGGFNYHWTWPGGSGSNANWTDVGTLILRINARNKTFTPSIDIGDGDGHWITTNYWHGSGSHPQTLYVDGLLEATINNEMFGSAIVQTNVGLGYLTSFSAEGVVNGHFIHNRNLSSAEIKSLHDNPWQMFEPRVQIIPIIAASAANPHGPFGHPLTGAFGGPI